MYLDYILSGHHQHNNDHSPHLPRGPHHRVPAAAAVSAGMGKVLLVPRPAIRPPAAAANLPLYMMHPMYNPLHHACDQFSAIEKNMFLGNYGNYGGGLVVTGPGGHYPIKVEKTTELADLLKEKWKRAKFMLKGKLAQALNNNEPYYPLDPTANIKTSAKNVNKKGVIVLRDKLGLQVFSNHPVTFVGGGGNHEEVLPAIDKPPGEDEAEEDDDYDTTPNDVYNPASHSHRPPEAPPVSPFAYGMPGNGPLNVPLSGPLSTTEHHETDAPSFSSSEQPKYQSSERPRPMSSSLGPGAAVNPAISSSTEQMLQHLIPSTLHPLPPHHHYPPPVTDHEQEMQTHDPQPRRPDDERKEEIRKHEARGQQEVNDPNDDPRRHRHQHQQQQEEGGGRQRQHPERTSPASDFDQITERRRFIMQHKPPDRVFLNLPRVMSFFDSYNSTLVSSVNAGIPIPPDLKENQAWKPVTRDPGRIVQEREPKITFEVQTNDPLTGTQHGFQAQPSNQYLEKVSLHPRMGLTEQPQRQVTTSATSPSAEGVEVGSSEFPTSTASSIILSSAASYFTSLNPSLSDHSFTRSQ